MGHLHACQLCTIHTEGLGIAQVFLQPLSVCEDGRGAYTTVGAAAVGVEDGRRGALGVGDCFVLRDRVFPGGSNLDIRRPPPRRRREGSSSTSSSRRESGEAKGPCYCVGLAVAGMTPVRLCTVPKGEMRGGVRQCSSPPP